MHKNPIASQLIPAKPFVLKHLYQVDSTKTAQEARGSGAASMLLQGKDALGDIFYNRHQPDQTLLYQIVEAHYPALVDQLAQQGKALPYHVRREFEGYLKCGRLEHG